jgi:hypothetical protein
MSGDKDMIYKENSRHDAYTFSLMGMSIVASVVAQPIVADDQITKAREAYLKERAEAASAPEQGAEKPRDSWFRRAGRRLAWGTSA